MADDYLSNLKSLVGRWQKTTNDPSYQPTDEENEAEKNYYSQLPSAMVGSVAPVEGVADGMLANETATKKIMDSTAENALNPTQEAKLVNNQIQLFGQNPSNIGDVVRTQQEASRAVDMADRYKAQLAARKSALGRMSK